MSQRPREFAVEGPKLGMGRHVFGIYFMLDVQRGTAPAELRKPCSTKRFRYPAVLKSFD
jgi:hypothetical protein